MSLGWGLVALFFTTERSEIDITKVRLLNTLTLCAPMSVLHVTDMQRNCIPSHTGCLLNLAVSKEGPVLLFCSSAECYPVCGIDINSHRWPNESDMIMHENSGYLFALER